MRKRVIDLNLFRRLLKRKQYLIERLIPFAQIAQITKDDFDFILSESV